MKKLALSVLALAFAVSCTKSNDEDLNIKELTPQQKEKAGMHKEEVQYGEVVDCILGYGHCVKVEYHDFGTIDKTLLFDDLDASAGNSDDIKYVINKYLSGTEVAEHILTNVSKTPVVALNVKTTSYGKYYSISDNSTGTKLMTLPYVID